MIEDIFETCMLCGITDTATNPCERSRPSNTNNVGSGAIAGIVTAVIVMILILTLMFTIAVLFKKHGKKTNGTVSTSTNQAYDVTHHDRRVEENFYNHPQVKLDTGNAIEVKQNEAYATNIIVTEGNDAYGTNNYCSNVTQS